MSKLLTFLPLIILAIGLIGWTLTLRADVTSTTDKIALLQQEIVTTQKGLDSERNVRIESHIDQSKDLVEITNDLNEHISGLEKSLAVANDQMQTIMGDHMGFAEVLKELGEAGVLPSGERRAYGGYGR